MASFNKVFLAGNLTRDPELRYTPKGLAVAKIGLAVNRKWKTETGEMKEEVSFIDVDAFGRQAETISQYMRKGRPFFVEGRLRMDTWEDKNTHQQVSKLKVVLESFMFMDSGNRDGASGNPPAPVRPPAAHPGQAAAAAAPAMMDEPLPQEGDDVPF